MAKVDADWKKIGPLVKDRRIAMELTQEQLAERAGISRTTLYTIEKGVPGPRDGVKVGQLSEALGFRNGALAEVALRTLEEPDVPVTMPAVESAGPVDFVLEKMRSIEDRLTKMNGRLDDLSSGVLADLAEIREALRLTEN